MSGERIIKSVGQIGSGNRAAHIMDGSPSRNAGLILFLPISDIIRDGRRRQSHHSSYIDAGEHGLLFFGLLKQSHGSSLSNPFGFFAFEHRFNILRGDHIDKYGFELCFFNRFTIKVEKYSFLSWLPGFRLRQMITYLRCPVRSATK